MHPLRYRFPFVIISLIHLLEKKTPFAMFYAVPEEQHACIFTFSPGWYKLSLKLYQKSFPY